MSQPAQDGFLAALAGINRQARRIQQPSDEVLQEFRRVTETVPVADGTPTLEDKPAGQYVWTTTPGDTQIIWAEWVWRNA